MGDLPRGRRLRALLCAVLALLLLCGCATGAGAGSLSGLEAQVDGAPVAEGGHEREEDYAAAFRTHWLTVGPLTVHMENRIYEETLLRDEARELLRALAAMERATGAAPGELAVYIVGELAGGRPVAAEGKVFCTLRDFDSGGAYEALAGAAYGLPAQWQRVGLAAWVFGEASDEGLRAWYADGAHALTASCSALHLSDALSDGETVRAARDTARSLCAYLIENEGFAAFRETADPAAILPAWAESLGITPAPSLPEGSAALAELRVEEARNYRCILRVQNYSVYVADVDWLPDTDGLYLWLCALFAGMERVEERIRAEAPSAAAHAAERLAEPVRIVFTDEKNSISGGHVSFTNYERNEIMLTELDAIWHEMTHLLLEHPGNRELDWECEAVAQHFSGAWKDYPYRLNRFLTDYEAFRPCLAEAFEEDEALLQGVWALYRSLAEPDRLEDGDLDAFYRACGVTTLLLYERGVRPEGYGLLGRSVAEVYGARSAPDLKSDEGNALSYLEAQVFLEFLAEKYGMDAVIDAYLKGLGLGEAFGLGYPELYAEAVSAYAARYGALPGLD